jgi:hypothetical protein
MGNVSDKICRENQNIRFIFFNFFFENRTVYEIMCKNIVELDRTQMARWRTRIACWIPKGTNTHCQNIIVFFLTFHDHSLILHYENKITSTYENI